MYLGYEVRIRRYREMCDEVIGEMKQVFIYVDPDGLREEQ